MRSLDYWQRYGAAAATVERAVPENDHVFVGEGRNLALYHCNGLSALRAILLAMILNDVAPPAAMMAFGCAFGRVLRYLRAAFPEVALTACDVREDGIAYCAEKLGAMPVRSSTTLSQIAFPRQRGVQLETSNNACCGAG